MKDCRVIEGEGKGRERREGVRGEKGGRSGGAEPSPGERRLREAREVGCWRGPAVSWERWSEAQEGSGSGI